MGSLEDMPLHVRQNMWFQHDDAPPHFTRAVRVSGSKIWANLDRSWWPDCLACTFTRPDSARLLPVGPARSPDLIPLDYFLWGRMKSLVYETPVDSKEDLLSQVVAAADIGDRVHENMVCRYRVCVEVVCRHIEPFL